MQTIFVAAIATYCLIIVAHADGDVKEAIVVINSVYRGKPNMALKCHRPIEESDVFKNCLPDSPDKQFPATTTTCDCTNCYKKMKLICNKNGKWYPQFARVCDRASKTGCGMCPVESIPEYLRCPKDKLNGFYNEFRYCLCKDTCSDFKIQCIKGKKPYWKLLADANTCLTNQTFSLYSKSHHLTKNFDNGIYTYTCDEGYRVEGAHTSNCSNGVVKPEKPRCVKYVTTTPIATLPTILPEVEHIPITTLNPLLKALVTTNTTTSFPSTTLPPTPSTPPTTTTTPPPLTTLPPITTTTPPPTTTLPPTTTTTPPPTTTLPPTTTTTTTPPPTTTLPPTTTTKPPPTTTLPPTTTTNPPPTTTLPPTPTPPPPTTTTTPPPTTTLPPTTTVPPSPETTTPRTIPTNQDTTTQQSPRTTQEAEIKYARFGPSILKEETSEEISTLVSQSSTQSSMLETSSQPNINEIQQESQVPTSDYDDNKTDNEIPILESFITEANFTYLLIGCAIVSCILLLLILLCVWCKCFKNRERTELQFISDTDNNHPMKHINTEEYLKDFNDKSCYEESRLFLARKKETSYDNESVNIELKKDVEKEEKYYAKSKVIKV